MLESFRVLKQADRVLDQFQSNVAQAFARLIGKNGNPVLDFQRIEEVAVVSGANAIPHKLGRVPLGWWVTRVDASVTIHELSVSTSLITLSSTGPALVDLYVF